MRVFRSKRCHRKEKVSESLFSLVVWISRMGGALTTCSLDTAFKSCGAELCQHVETELAQER